MCELPELSQKSALIAGSVSVVVMRKYTASYLPDRKLLITALPSSATTSTVSPIFFSSSRITAAPRSSVVFPFCVISAKRAGRLAASSSRPSPLRSARPTAASSCPARAGSCGTGGRSAYHFRLAAVIGP